MSTSKLQRKVKRDLAQALPDLTINENRRPSWLSVHTDGQKVELDFYIPELAIAIEVQGRQHSEYVPFFHGDEAGYQAQQQRDRVKAEACERLGITLYEVYGPDDWQQVLAQIQACEFDRAKFEALRSDYVAKRTAKLTTMLADDPHNKQLQKAHFYAVQMAEDDFLELHWRSVNG